MSGRLPIAMAGLILLLLAGCATEPPIAQTSSGRPEAVFRSTGVSDVQGKISQGCMNAGLVIYDASANQVVCGKTMEGGDAILAQLLIGNSYSTTPERRIRFTLAKVGSNVRVQAFQWYETQMAFGQVNRSELNSGKQFNEVQRFLYNIGGQ